MGRFALVALLALSLVAPAFAAANSALPVTGFAVSGSGTVSGTGRLGGVPGTITSTATSPSTGDWTMTVGGVVFATGTYSCSGGCTYTGAVIGSKTTFSFGTLSSPAALSAATGFTTHGGWVSTVGHWAAQHRAALANAGLTVGEVVAAAAHSGSAHAGGTGGSGHTAFSGGALISSGGGDGHGADHGVDHGRGR